MTFIFYSSICPPGRYWLEGGRTGHEDGICVEIKWKAHNEPEPDYQAPPPPEVKGVGERWDRIDKSLETIADSLEGIYELLNRR